MRPYRIRAIVDGRVRVIEASDRDSALQQLDLILRGHGERLTSYRAIGPHGEMLRL